jgi:hypothetical protein
MALVFAAAAAMVSAQTPDNARDAGASAPTTSMWSVSASAATYALPDDDNYVQPIVAVDRDALHLEGRYNYEDRHSFSGFIGWNFAAGSKVKLELTPMVGGVVGDADGVIPAVELTLTFSRFEVYSEGEYVIDAHRRNNSFLYNWSEASVWATEWLRAGLVTQRTRTVRLPRDIQRGLLAGISIGKIEGVFYFFNPGSDDSYVVASLGVSF